MNEEDLEHVDPATLVGWDRNPRVNDHAVAPVARSIERFGFAAPIVARRSDRRVLAGHTRMKAAAMLELDAVPVRWVDLDDGEAEAYSLADNKLAEAAQWDDSLLADVITDLQADGVEVSDLGWTTEDLESIVSGLGTNIDDQTPDEPTEIVEDMDEDAEPPTDVYVKPGDLWLLGAYYECEDCGKRYTVEEGEALAECPCG